MQEGTSIIIKEGTLAIADMAFYGCAGLKSINIGNSITSIGTGVFSGCIGLESIAIPNSVTSIGGSAFYGCTGLTRVTIPNSVTIIDHDVFNGCTSLSNVTIPNTVTEIGSYAFHNCTGLISITIPNSVIIINNSAFYGCTGLTSITIGSSVSSIDYNAFINATSIEKIICFATTPPLLYGTDVFSVNVYNHAQLHVLTSSVSAYKSNPNWGKFITIIGDISGDGSSDNSDYIKCDVNGDGEVNIADINAIIGLILAGITESEGDVNGDGEVNIADINRIIDEILSHQTKATFQDQKACSAINTGFTDVPLLYQTAEVGGAVEVAVGDGFHDVVVEDVGGALEVGDGAGYLEDAVVGPRAHVHAVHGVAKFFEAGGVGLGVFVQQGRGHLGVAVDAGFVLEAALLQHPRGDNALTDGGAGFAWGFT